MADAASAPTPPKLTFAQQMTSFPRTFWVANVIELVERFSFWGVRVIASLYILAPKAKGGLELTNDDKAIFFGVWALIQCLLPMFTGGFADRYGYRVSLMVAFCINLVGYGLMGFTQTWWGFMTACCLIGTGTAIFKPPLHGTLAHCVNESNSSVGWGMFYQVVNIGAFFGPIIMGYLRVFEWRYAFFLSAGVILINVLVTALFLEDYAKPGLPGRDQRKRRVGFPVATDEADADAAGRGDVIDLPAKPKGPAEVLSEALHALAEPRFIVFLAIFSGFWFMFMQLSDQITVFIDQWIDRRDVGHFLTDTLGLHFLRSAFEKAGGQVNAEWIQDVDAGAIIILVLLVAYITGKFRHISAMIVGMFLCCAGFVLVGSVRTGWPCVLAIFIFAVGEMACSPKFSEYIGLMAPPDKKALYMGFSNIPFAVGWSGANFIGGPLYERVSDQAYLARQYLTHHLGQSADVVDVLPKEQLIPRLAELLGKTPAEAQQLLWTTYHPQYFFYVCTAIGLLATFAMVGYHFWLQADAKKRASALQPVEAMRQ